ncbi:MAG TPA: TIGR00730 family Rossman fold protein [Thermoanaerobaculia bacterium]
MFCGSSAGRSPLYRQAAARLGTQLAERGLGLVYGGASVGLMGAVADAALAGGGEVLGVLPDRLFDREVAHPGLTELLLVGSMHERKARMAEMADGFLALPGGIGTLDELFEIWTWAQLGLHAKPIGLLDIGGYFQPLLAFLDHQVREGFLHPSHRALATVDADLPRLLDRLQGAFGRPAAAGLAPKP